VGMVSDCIPSTCSSNNCNVPPSKYFIFLFRNTSNNFLQMNIHKIAKVCLKFLFRTIAVRDRMFLEMKDLDFCPNLIKFYPNLTQFIQIYPNLPKYYTNLPNLA